MEIEGAKTIVFGIGGVGCKILNGLAERVPNNTELIALDREQAQLDGLGDRVGKVKIGDALAKRGSFDEIKGALDSEIIRMETSLESVNLAVIIMSLGGKTGSCIGNFMAELCENKGIFTLVIPIYPLTKGKRGAGEVDASVTRLREKADGVLIVDNNLKKGKGNLPMLSVFKKVNFLVADMVILLITSISSMGWMNLSKDELKHFFHGDVFFLVTSGEGKNLQEASQISLKEIDRYAEVSHVKRVLVLMSAPFEVSIEEMRELNGSIQDKLDPEAIKWISSASEGGDVRSILVSAVSELPLVQGVTLPEHVGKEEPEGGDRPDGEEEEGVKGPSEGEGRQKSEFEEFLNLQLAAQRKQEEERVKSPALMGLSKEEKVEEEPEEPEAIGEPEEEEPRADEEGEIEDIVNELVGFPSFKKKGQKKLGDYKGDSKDDMGIGYI